MNKDEMKSYEKGYADGQRNAIDTMNYFFKDEANRLRQETAREIIAIIIDDDGADLNKIAQKYGIELG